MFYGRNQSKAPEIAVIDLGEGQARLDMEAGFGAKIYYTIDGSTPTRDSILYNGTVTLEDASPQENRLSSREDLSVQNYTIPKYKIDKAWCIKAKA